MTTSREQADASPFQNWRTVLPLVLWSGLTIIAIVLISRKLAGAFAQDLSATGGCFGVTLAVWISFAATVLYHMGRRHMGRRSDSRSQTDRPGKSVLGKSGAGELVLGESVLMGIVALTAPLLIGLALLPGDSLGALLYAAGLFLFLLTGVVLLAANSLAGLVSLVSESFPFPRQPEKILPDDSRPEGVSETAWPSTDSPASILDSLIDGFPGDALSSRNNESGDELEDESDNESGDELVFREDESVSQQFTRTRTAAGTERISGSLAVSFAAGQRQATVHLPFVPPLATSPSVDCDIPEGHAVRLKVAAVHCYGIRVELKRSPDLKVAETIEIGFTVTAPALAPVLPAKTRPAAA